MGKSKQTGRHNIGKKKNIVKTWKTKRRTRDLDEIHVDMIPANAAKLLKQEIDYDVTELLPSIFNMYHFSDELFIRIFFCMRYFVDMKTVKEHFKTKEHKKR